MHVEASGRATGPAEAAIALQNVLAEAHQSAGGSGRGRGSRRGRGRRPRGSPGRRSTTAAWVWRGTAGGSYGIHADRPDAGTFVRLDGPVHTARRMFRAAALVVVESLGVVVEVFFGPGGLQVALLGPADAVPAVAGGGG